MIDTFEWTRPLWLLALPAGGAILWAWWRAQVGRGLWHRHVDAELLEHLAGTAQASSARLAIGIAAAVLVLTVCALAGPVWRAQAAAPQRDPGARIVVLDLSPSMDAIDVAPSRLRRARDATAALLRGAAGAKVGVVVFGGDAFSVAPLTYDAATLVHLLAGVSTTTVPRAGSRPDLGLEMARALLNQAGAGRGDVILVGDSGGDARTLEAARALARGGFPVSVLAVGTAQGGPIPVATGAFARNESGDIRIATAELAALEHVAQAGGGRFEVLRAPDDLPSFARQRGAGFELRAPRATQEKPHDAGAWLALLALPLAALLFRRGWLAAFAALSLLPALAPPQAHAFDWDSLWRRTDQQAAAAFVRAKPSDTARVLSRLEPDSPWYAMILYRSGNFAEAAAQFAAGDTAVAHYNRGNAHALDGDLEGAIAAYDAALARNPAMQDAKFNRALVRKALAARPMEPADGEPGSSRQKSSSSGGRSRGAARDRAEPSDGAGRRAQVDEFGKLPQLPSADARERAKDEGASHAAGRLSPEERDRLERLLSKVPDDAGSLLASRFAEHLRLRGTPHPDTGARW
jgi:Ca-activated chloride channel family protein